MKLFIWSRVKIDSTDCTIYAIAETIEKAKQIAINKIRDHKYKEIVREHLEKSSPSTHEDSTSWISSGDSVTLVL